MNYYLRPLTESMIEKLQLARAIELSETDDNFCMTHHFANCLSGLIQRGMVATKMREVNGKKIMQVYLTKSGIDFLEKYDSVQKV